MKFTNVQPTHRCQTCGAYWKEWDDSWSLLSSSCGKCCDQTSMASVLPLIVYNKEGKEI